ncbi:NAD(P)/FAD-dependent oxidoreductase [Litorihabitans aurantiacus]|uniref:D-amino-acid dehydrogenase n=1 Tax=Litorihabitans aurantiacus TaxID=1930061 RepID=A0AA37UWN8_9MICO|nr:FAD-dependent oxidoreductase [Litorihabitans aurantiacus]GMA30547.1 D-amino-acid dehydrogenase [Litorihabitans aurantiacus]
MATRRFPQPRTAIVVGAGIVGLSTAHHLRRAGLEVTVLEAEHVGAGASWGNAGWLTPTLTIPLPDPSILAAGLRALASPSSPVYVPLRADPNLLRFLAGFLRHCTWDAWRRSMAALVPLNARALTAYDTLAEHGLSVPTRAEVPFVAAYARETDRATLLHELRIIAESGQEAPHELLDGDGVRALVPAASDRVEAGVLLHGTRHIDPPRFLEALADLVRRDGVRIVEGLRVTSVSGGDPRRPAGVRVVDHTGVPPRGRTARGDHDGAHHSADVVVLASGARLGELAHTVGVRRVVQAGRGYSFTVPVEHLPSGPFYLPAQRVACTPLRGRLRVAGMMEFRRPGEPLDRRRIEAIRRAAEPMITGADFDDRQQEWVGSRPCTTDGLPLVGPTRSPRVLLGGGHGMWGVTLGPLTGELLAETVVTGVVPEVLRPLDPLR